jgi:hypothetical protein
MIDCVRYARRRWYRRIDPVRNNAIGPPVGRSRDGGGFTIVAFRSGIDGWHLVCVAQFDITLEDCFAVLYGVGQGHAAE